MNKRKSNIDDSRLQEKVSDTATDPIMPECEEDASEHQIDFVMKMPNTRSSVGDNGLQLMINRLFLVKYERSSVMPSAAGMLDLLTMLI